MIRQQTGRRPWRFTHMPRKHLFSLWASFLILSGAANSSFAAQDPSPNTSDSAPPPAQATPVDDLKKFAGKIGDFFQKLGNKNPPDADVPAHQNSPSYLRVHVLGGEDDISRSSLDDNQYVKVTAISEAQGDSQAVRLFPGKDNKLSPGRYAVTVVHPRFAPQTVEITLTAGQTSTVSLTLVARTDAAASVTLPPSAPPPVPVASPVPVLSNTEAADANGRLRISVWDAEQQSLLNSVATLHLTTEAAGGLMTYDIAPGRFTVVPPGRYMITAKAPGFQENVMEANVVAGKTSMIECRLTPVGK